LTGTRRRLVATGVGVLLAGGLAGGLLGTGGQSGTFAAPFFSLPRLGGGPVVRVPVVRDGSTAPVVVTFFASWCGPCYSELPLIAQVADQLDRAGSPVVFIGVDGNDLDASGLAFARRAGVTFAVGVDHPSAVAPRYGIQGYPATVFIDRHGTVAHVVRGPVNVSALRTWAARLARSS
jgi:cytochrome c biogenesis protein CcmG/thiol:disulfide interchange protein DsbE